MDLMKRLVTTTLSTKKKKKKSKYPIPPNADRPTPPSTPEIIQEEKYFILRWEAPAYDGGIPLIGYVIQHLELGLPQLDTNDQVNDTEAWYSSEPGQITQTECILNNLVPGTTYQFRIVAENLIGFSDPSGVSEGVVFNPHGELDDWFSPPTFTTLLDDSYTVMEHEMLTLSVELKGQPYPLTRWLDKNEQDLVQLDPKRFKARSSGYNRTLVINSVELSDAGWIKCVGVNKEGVVECGTTIIVEAPPRLHRIPRPDLLPLQNPYEISDSEMGYLKDDNNYDEDENLIFQNGELARIKFIYSGAPKPEVTVFHEGEEVFDGRRVFKEITEKMITLKIDPITRTDRGEWLVKLENVLGEDFSSILITVTGTPEPPGKPEILQLSDNTCILRWDLSVDDGGCPVHNYIVEYFRSEWGVWLKALTSKNAGAKIKDLIPGSKYRFRVKGENLYGVGEASEESAEILITDLPSAARRADGLMPSLEEHDEDENVFERVLKEGNSKIQPPPIPRSPKPNQRRVEPQQQQKMGPSTSLTVPQQAQPQGGLSPTPPIKRSPSPTPPIAQKAPVYTRGDLIPSAVASNVDYLKRFLDETTPSSPQPPPRSPLGSPLTDEEYEYDFDKLQKEYEEEMSALKLQLLEHDEFDDEEEDIGGEMQEDEDEEEEEEIKAEDEVRFVKKSSPLLPATQSLDVSTAIREKSPRPQSQQDHQEPLEDDSSWPRHRHRTTRSEEKHAKPPLQHDRFKEYIKMKASSTSTRSLTSSKPASQENVRTTFPPNQHYPPSSSEDINTHEEDDEESPSLQTVRRAILENEKRIEAEALARERQKEEEKRAAEEKEAELEERRRLNRLKLQKGNNKSVEMIDADVTEEIIKSIDPEKISKIVLAAILIIMIPIYFMFDVYVMLFAFVGCLLAWNKFGRGYFLV